MNTKILNTKNCLYSALIELTKNSSVHEITVTELCKKAGINRTTFYKYFTSPEDVGQEYVLLKISGFADRIRGKEQDLFLLMLDTCRLFSEELGSLSNLLGDVNSLDRIIRHFLLLLRHDLSLSASSDIYFVAGGVSSVIAHWQRHEPELPAEQIAEKLVEYIRRLGNVGQRA